MFASPSLNFDLLHKTKNADFFMTGYLQKKRSLPYQYAVAARHVVDFDMVIYILVGLVQIVAL